MITLFKPVEEIPIQFQGEFTTQAEAEKTAMRLGVVGGGVVEISDDSMSSPSPVPEGKGFFNIAFANGEVVNAALAAFKLANNPDLKAFDIKAKSAAGPRGVAFLCTEGEYYKTRQWLSNTGEAMLAPQTGGTVGLTQLDTDVVASDGLGLPPQGSRPANYVIQLQNGVIVNAAFIGYMLENFGTAGALAFAQTRVK